MSDEPMSGEPIEWHTHDWGGGRVHTHSHPGGTAEHNHDGWTLKRSLNEPARLYYDGWPASDEVVPLNVSADRRLR